jgi:hypothetical protein
MPSILLIPSTPAAFFHTPQTVALLQDAGYGVAVAAEQDSPFAEYIRVATNREPVSIKGRIRGYKAVLMAPCTPDEPIPEATCPIIAAPIVGSNDDGSSSNLKTRANGFSVCPRFLSRKKQCFIRINEELC